MNSSLFNFPSPQQALAGSGQHDDGTLGRALQLPSFAPAMCSQVNNIDALESYHPFGYETSSFLQTAAHDPIWTIPEDFRQPYEQPAVTAEHSHTLEPQLSWEEQLALAEEDIRHAQARKRILETYRPGRTIPRQEQQTHLYNGTGFSQYAGTDISNTGSSNPSNSTSVQTILDQTVQDNPYMEIDQTSHSFGPDILHTNIASKASLDSNTSNLTAFEFTAYEATALNSGFIHDYTPAFTSSHPQYNNAVTSYSQSMLQRPTTEQVPHDSSSYLDPYPVPVAYDQGLPASYLAAPHSTGSAQPTSLQPDDPLHSTDARVLLATSDVTSDPIMTAGFPVSPSFTDVNASYPSFSMVDQSNTPDLDSQHLVIPAVLSQTQSIIAKTSRERQRSGIRDMHTYISPAAEREYNKTVPRTRNVKSKSAWSCFRCWLVKRKVRFFIQHHMLCSVANSTNSVVTPLTVLARDVVAS